MDAALLLLLLPASEHGLRLFAVTRSSPTCSPGAVPKRRHNQPHNQPDRESDLPPRLGYGHLCGHRGETPRSNGVDASFLLVPARI